MKLGTNVNNSKRSHLIVSHKSFFFSFDLPTDSRPQESMVTLHPEFCFFPAPSFHHHIKLMYYFPVFARIIIPFLFFLLLWRNVRELNRHLFVCNGKVVEERLSQNPSLTSSQNKSIFDPYLSEWDSLFHSVIRRSFLPFFLSFLSFSSIRL